MRLDLYLPITGDSGYVIAVVPAEIVDIAPHITCATWAVHKTDDYWRRRGWVVSNIETGCRIGNSLRELGPRRYVGLSQQ